jgi:hypothetical protein
MRHSWQAGASQDIGTWIRQRRQHLRVECRGGATAICRVDELAFESAIRETRRHLLAPSDRSPAGRPDPLH